MKALFLVLAIGCIALAIWWMLGAIDTNEEKAKIIISVLAGILFILLSPLGQLFPKKDIPPDYERLKRPQLEPVLVVEFDGDKDFKYEYRVENKGEYPANNIQYLTKTNEFKSVEYEATYQRELLKGGKHTFKPNRYTENYEKDRDLKFDLVALYESTILGKDKYYKDTFKYTVRDNDKRFQEIYYEYSTHEQGAMTSEEKVNFVDAKSDLESNEGTLSFSFDPNDQNQTTSSIMINESSKIVTYDPNEKTITYIYRTPSHSFALVKEIKQDGRALHKVAISWSPEEIKLAVDGELVKTKK